ncbi:MAG: hypothetical protein ACYDCO_07255 [Armatimonadota bacterium]
MNVFDPRTFSTDWEHIVVDRLDRCVDTRRLLGFAGVLFTELQLPIIVDKESLEFPLGINHSFDQLWDRIRRTTDRAEELLREYDLDLYPAAAHPQEKIYNSSHVHVGTILDETAGLHLENHLLKYAPAFAALAANAPVAHGMYLEFKSYRVRDHALQNIRPGMIRVPQTSQRVWGDDLGPKLNMAPTFEVRIIDCASSRRLLAEMAVFTAAFVHSRGEQIEEAPTGPEEYLEYLINRWTAARDGMQATFRWDGKPRTVAEILDEMLDSCETELAVLGASRAHLPIVNGMVHKRICQADMVVPLARRHPDPYLLANAYGKMLRHWEWFEEFLEGAAPLEPRPMVSDGEILAEHLKLIGEGTHLYQTRETMSFPPPAADAVRAQLIAAGQVAEEFTLERGLTLSRVERRASLTPDPSPTERGDPKERP